MQFHELTVTDVQNTSRDATVVTLAPKPGEEAAFRFMPGQHLTFRRDFDGEELRRSYSLCVSPGDGMLKVGIKRVDGGAFSNWVNDTLRPGDVIEAMPPSGVFHLPEARSARNYLGFAGGSGITPVLSILKTVLEEEPGSNFTLVYANRAVNTIMFREELEDLKNRYMGRLTVIHVLENDTQEIDLFTGRVDATKCAQLFSHWIDLTAIDATYICGPEPMMKSIEQALLAQDFPADAIHYELFLSAQPGRLARKVAAAKQAGGDTEAIITIDGATRNVQMNRDTSVLEAALANDLPAPYSCTAGVCSTCMAKVTEGEVEMRANHALEDHEVAAGYVLTCQCYPLSDKVVVNYDVHG
ncbi:ferredoxin--NADP reductase [Sinisalibacter aestuarii]|uniref:Phenylacetic acid degradation protein n=1 Tax=Sinisalibacter aestuarii TaxID=2949426 RepID=A0ABQ5LR61_9RHOB|nr:ferredoxin--NADP reductase [Sinisalibacter aestuarii]GKY87208.1 phenylacetic acid degradation protein [Sinisalibacter aestuarii]